MAAAGDVDEVIVARLAWRSSASVVALALGGGFVVLCAVAVIRPWSLKLEFPLYRAILGAVASVLAYLGLSSLINSTIIAIAAGELRTHHRGLPMLGFGPRPVRIPLRDIERIEDTPGGIRAKGPGVDRLIIQPPDARRRELAARIASAAGVPLGA